MGIIVNVHYMMILPAGDDPVGIIGFPEDALSRLASKLTGGG
jgi:hypothetical protein